MEPLSKIQWRAHLRAQRLSMDDGARHRAAEGLASAGLEWVSLVRSGPAPLTICAYVSVGPEPSTALLLTTLSQAGDHVFVPVCRPGHQLSWVSWHPGVPMQRSTLAPVMEPVGRRHAFAALGPVAALLLPALAVDTSGVRLGQGGGYYDRFLASLQTTKNAGLPGVPAAAVVYDHEVLAPHQLPHDALDQPVDYLLTPDNVRPAAK
ncbi:MULTISPECIES: 5-formyltetrahydrofolate cyclo-ligase [Arthrobacter]|uniref:5-formyltetrahydrofolate cyclo-ligase n=1 Tax=Arthrobacter TaxID=1663 RepID=UPI0007863D36|nr:MULTISPECIES: 5-formyltetrahydrofolate cyclo-ligase [Arthrobacter]